MKHDEIQMMKRPAVDLLYPTQEAFDALKKRRADISSLSQDYIANLELEKLAEILLPSHQYQMLNMFKQMCTDPEVMAYRCDILEDFMNVPKLAATIRKVIGIMIENDRSSLYDLSEPDSFVKLDEAVNAFDAYVRCMEIMHGFYIEKKDEIVSEGVKRLFLYFEEQYEDKRYNKMKELVSELKAAIKNRIRSVTVAINLDERLVPDSVGIVEYSSERYDVKPSLFDKILYHGAKFPEKTVMGKMKNKYGGTDFSNEKVLNTVDENLFSELSSITDDYIDMINKAVKEYQRIGLEDVFSLDYQLEFYDGAVRLIELCRDCGLEMCRPKILPASERRAHLSGLFDIAYFNESRIWNLKHKDKKSVVTNDLDFDENAGFYILTGANNGGKTTFLRAVGVCQVMAQTGLYVPASECELSIVDFIYTHFPKEEQTGINSSRFTTEIKEFKTISDTITSRSLLLMNESIQSTTPQECVDIASELVKIFCMVGVRGIFATHILDLAEKTEEINAAPSVRTKTCSIVAETDEATGERRYKIKKGMPAKTSFALSVFKEFGIDRESIEKRIMQTDSLNKR